MVRDVVAKNMNEHSESDLQEVGCMMYSRHEQSRVDDRAAHNHLSRLGLYHSPTIIKRPKSTRPGQQDSRRIILYQTTCIEHRNLVKVQYRV